MLLLAWALGVSVGACAPRERSVQVRFAVHDGDAVHRLQFYVHDIVLIGADGQGYPFTLESRPPWQSERVALLDFAGATAQRDAVEGSATPHRYTGVRFKVGVPFDLNHANQLTAAAPLDRAEMFWSWQSGYKFWRLDLSTGEHEAVFHLGSTGCSSASALRPPQQPCMQPNVMQVELTGFDPLTQPIHVRVNEIVEALGVGEVRACTGDYARSPCANAFAATGLDVATGQCIAAEGASRSVCAQQRLFAVD